MEKKLFQKTEGRLYGYYESLKMLDSLKLDIQELKIQKEEVERNIREGNVSLEGDLNMGISYDEKVQTSSNGTSYAEKEMLSRISKFERELREIEDSIEDSESVRRRIKRSINGLKRNIEAYDEETQMFLKLKYKDKKSDDAIGSIMFGGVRSTAYRKRVDIIEDIVKWSKMYETNVNQ